jgi:hypothetical protein
MFRWAVSNYNIVDDRLTNRLWLCYALFVSQFTLFFQLSALFIAFSFDVRELNETNRRAQPKDVFLMPTVECKCWDYGSIWLINILFFPQNSLVWYSLYVSVYFVAIIRSRDSIVVMTGLRAGRPKKYYQLEQEISFQQGLELVWGLTGFLFDELRVEVN